MKQIRVDIKDNPYEVAVGSCLVNQKNLDDLREKPPLPLSSQAPNLREKIILIWKMWLEPSVRIFFEISQRDPPCQ